MSLEPPDIEPVLSSHDAHGARGCCGIQERTNILVSCESRRLDDRKLVLTVMQMAVEGYGLSEFWTDHVFVPKDQVLQQQTVLWQHEAPPPCSPQLIWLRNVASWDLGGINYVYDEHSFTMPLITNPASQHCIHLLELYAGGYGGWRSAADYITSHLQHGTIRSIAIEHDHQAAMSYAISNHAGFYQAQDNMPSDFFQRNEGDWVIRDDVRSPKWKHATATLGIDMATISAPCQPWTGANHSPGLNREDGLLLLDSILEMRFVRPLFFCLEQVSNFAVHPHRSIITRAIHWIGYKVIFQRILNTCDTLKTDRPRFFLVAVRVHAEARIERIPTWRLDDVQVNPINVVFKCWTQESNPKLMLDEQAFRIADDPRLTRHATSGSSVLATRIYSSDQTTPTFMSMYGQQHTLDFDYLLLHKFFGHYLRDEEFPHGCRHWHSSEMALRHGLTGPSFQFDDNCDGWKIQGNVVTTLQVLPFFVAACNHFWQQELDVTQVVNQYLQSRWSSDDVGFQRLSTGFLMTLIQDPVSNEQLEKYDECIRQLFDRPFDDFCWFPDATTIPSSQPMGFQATQISMPTPASTQMQEEDTQEFRVILKAVIRFESKHQTFWFEGGLPYHVLPRPWDSVYAPFSMDGGSLGDPQVELVYDLDRIDHEQPQVDPGLLLMLADAQLTVMSIPRDMAVVDHPAVQDLPAICDQYGHISSDRKTDKHLVVLPEPLPCTTHEFSLPFVMTAFPMCKISWCWNPVTDTILVGITGDSVPRQTLAQFWAHVMHSDALITLGRKIEYRSTASQFVILFAPARDHGVCPHMPFRTALASAATTALLKDAAKCDVQDGTTVHFQWKNICIWEGRIPYAMTVGTVLNVMVIANQPIAGTMTYRLMDGDASLVRSADFAFLRDRSGTTVPHFEIQTGTVLRLQGGGGLTQSKNQQRVYQQSSLASMMLEYGFELAWVKTTVDTLMDKYGLAKIQAITSQPMGGGRVKQLLDLCEEAKIALPKGFKPSSQHPPAGLPWKPNKRRNEGVALDPAEFQLFPGFFQCADGTSPEHLSDIRPQSCGICMLTAQQALPWLQAGQVTSSDELAILIPGKLPTETKLPHESLRFPCYNRSQQMILVSGTIIQMGTKHVTWQKDDANKVSTEECTLLALTMHREDFNEQQWLDITTKTTQAVKRILANDNADYLQSIWGRSLRAGRAPTNAKLATSVQVHAMLPNIHLDELLRRSGFNGVFCTPKTANGRLSQEFKVLWSTADATQARCQATQIQGCLGLVKGRNTLGFRVRMDDFDRGWNILHPGVAPPTKTDGTLMYKAMGLPFGVTNVVMKQWCEKQKWDAFPVKALGPTGWLLRATDHPKEGLHMFNGSPILLQFLPDKASTTSPVIVGPKGTAPVASDPFQAPGNDPWAGFRGTQASAPRNLPGPTEQRLTAQDDKITNLQSDFQKLLRSQETLRAETTQQLGALEQKTGEQFAVVHQSMSKLEQEVGKSLKLSLQQNTQMMDSRMQELKELLQKPRAPKRPQGADRDEEELSDIED
eukprot:Skav217963  [mRNA]  locus=scaffold3450:106770:111347:- [translate_table: standard]